MTYQPKIGRWSPMGQHAFGTWRRMSAQNGSQIIDWFHAVRHFSEAALALYPDENASKNRIQWLTTYKDHPVSGTHSLYHRCSGHPLPKL